jgi:hypothetical protein
MALHYWLYEQVGDDDDNNQATFNDGSGPIPSVATTSLQALVMHEKTRIVLKKSPI